MATGLCAVSDSYGMMLVARLLVSSCHGLFFGVAMVIATRLAPPDRQNSAISLIVAGVTLSAVLGIPLGTAIGNAYGWRTTFWVIAVAGVLAAVALFFLIPTLRDPERRADSFAAELRAATGTAALLCYGIIVLFMTGVFGNLIGGRLGDWKSTPTMIGILVLFIVFVLAVAMVVTQTWPLIAMLCLAWLVGFGFPAPVQARILKEAQDAPNFASTLISTAFNIGIAAGAAVGGAAIAIGWGYGALPLIGAAFLTLALLGTLALAVLDRRTPRSLSRRNASSAPDDENELVG